MSEYQTQTLFVRKKSSILAILSFDGTDSTDDKNRANGSEWIKYSQ